MLATVKASQPTARRTRQRIAAALLVAPADPAKFVCETQLPTHPLPFPIIIVSSRNDPWLLPDRARLWGERWGARIIDIGQAGHINAESGHGPWPFVFDLIGALEGSLRRTRIHATA